MKDRDGEWGMGNGEWGMVVGGGYFNKTWTHRTRVRELHSQDVVKEGKGASSDI